MKERDIWRCAAAIFGGKLGLIAIVAAAIYPGVFLAWQLSVDRIETGFPPTFAHMVACCVALYSLGALATLSQLTSQHLALVLAPNARSLESALRTRLWVFAILFFMIAMASGAYRLVADRVDSLASTFLKYEEISSAPNSFLTLLELERIKWATRLHPLTRDFFASGLILAQFAAYVWILARWLKVPVRFWGLIVILSMNSAFNRYTGSWGLIVFLVVAVGFTLWRFVNRDKKERATGQQSSVNGIDSASQNVVSRWVREKNRASLLRMIARVRDRSGQSRVQETFAFVPSNYFTGSKVFHIAALAFGLVALRNQIGSEVFVIVGVFFIGLVSSFFIVTQLQPMLMMPIRFNRAAIARSLVVYWTKRTAVIWLASTFVAFVWMLLSRYAGLWLPFEFKGRLPWAEEDWLLSFFGANLLVMMCVGIGLSMTTNLVFAASPFFAKSQRRYTYVRIGWIYVPAASCLGLEILLRSMASIQAISTSMSLRLLLASCVILPLAALMYFLVAKRSWADANLAAVSASLRAYQRRIDKSLGELSGRPTSA